MVRLNRSAQPIVIIRKVTIPGHQVHGGLFLAAAESMAFIPDLIFAWLNENGDASKPFLLPQKDPDFYDDCLTVI